MLNSVAVEGSSSERAAVARNMTLRAGAPLSASDLSTLRRRLYETGSYRSVDIALEPAEGNAPPTAERTTGDRNVIARIRVEERPRYSFRYGLAMNDDVVAPGRRAQKLGFAADLQNSNVLGLGASLGLSARIRRDQEVGRAFLYVPRFFGAPVRSNLFLSRGRQQATASIDEFQTTTTSDVTEIGGEQTFLVKRVEVRYGYNLGRNQTTIESSFSDPTVVAVRVARLTSSGLIDRRNDPFDPSHGWFSSANLELSQPSLGSQLSFLNSFIQQFQFVPVGHHVIVASALRLGLARTFQGETLIPRERFFAGGATSVRGYPDNDLGPRSIFGDADGGAGLLIVNGELRFPIYKWLKGVGFVDLGNVYPTVRDMFHSGVQFGAGGGVRASTPVGLLRFDLAAPLNPRSFDPSWTFHFGLGHAF
jgi:outer membrane protein assembly factor BamA